MTFEFQNRGGEVTDPALHYDGPHSLTLSPTGRWETNREGSFILHQADRVPLEYPISFGLAYTDRFGEQRRIQFEIRQGRGFCAITDPLAELDPTA